MHLYSAITRQGCRETRVGREILGQRCDLERHADEVVIGRNIPLLADTAAAQYLSRRSNIIQRSIGTGKQMASNRSSRLSRWDRNQIWK
jgi:hypothetical protein